MEKIYSKIQPDKLLHQIWRREDFKHGRKDLVEPDEFLQCAALQMNKGLTFRPHKHNWRYREWNVICQESWVVIQGSVKCQFYDIDDKIIAEPILNAGDASFSFGAGHNYLILEDSSLIYEMKSGKYEGQAIDKTFID